MGVNVTIMFVPTLDPSNCSAANRTYTHYIYCLCVYSGNQVPRIAIVITDGGSQRPPETFTAAVNLRAAGKTDIIKSYPMSNIRPYELNPMCQSYQRSITQYTPCHSPSVTAIGTIFEIQS